MVEKTKTLSDKKKEPVSCSKCGRIIPPKEHYVQDIITGDVTCNECEDNRLLLKGETFFSID